MVWGTAADVKTGGNLIINGGALIGRGEGEDFSGITKNTLKENPKIDSIFCFSDLIAYEVLRELEKLNRQDIIVIGFDEIQKERCYPIKKIEAALKECGFEIIKIRNALFFATRRSGQKMLILDKLSLYSSRSRRYNKNR